MMFQMPNQVSVVFQNTTPAQIRLVLEQIQTNLSAVQLLCEVSQARADDGIMDPDLEALRDGMENMLTDFEVDGFEVEEQPRYNLWLDT